MSNIILRTDTTDLNEKGYLVNSISAEINIYLTEHSWKIKLHHLNRGKLQFNKKGSTVVSNTFIIEISRVFNRQFKINSSRNFEECNSDVSFDAEQLSFCDKTLKSIRNDNVGKLIFTIYSFEHKFHQKQI